MAGDRKTGSFPIAGEATTRACCSTFSRWARLRTHLPPESYAAYTASYDWKNIHGRELLYSGPLFTHQLSHMWVDFRGIRDEFMRKP